MRKIARAVRQFLAKHAGVLKHPLFLTIAAAVLGAILIPQITNEWQDRQKEQELKQSLLEEMSTSSTTAVRQGVSLAIGRIPAAGGTEGESTDDVYAELRNSWLIHRASARSRIIVYFPDLYACWYSYERAVADFLSLGSGERSKTRVTRLHDYVDSDFATSYGDADTGDGCAPLDDLPPVVQMRFAELKDHAIKWNGLAYPNENTAFRNSYMALAEALLIGMERIVYTVEKTPADGFSHGLW